MDDVSEARPLAKLQEQLEESTEVTATEEGGDGQVAASGEAGRSEVKLESSPQEVQISRKPLLNNIDNELDRLARVGPRSSTTDPG